MKNIDPAFRLARPLLLSLLLPIEPLAPAAHGQAGATQQPLYFGRPLEYAYVNAPLLETNRSFTVELWAQRFQRTNALEHFVSPGAAGGNNHSLRFTFRPDNSLSLNFGSNELRVASANSDTNWHLWAFVYYAANGSRRIVRDGVSLASDTSVGLSAGGKSSLARDENVT